MRVFRSNGSNGLIPYRTLPESVGIALSPVRKPQIPIGDFLAESVVKTGVAVWKGVGRLFKDKVGEQFRAREGEVFSADLFRYVNRRGIRGYSHDLFDDIPPWLSLRMRPQETVFGRMVLSLREQAVVADWGGAAGIVWQEAAENLRTNLNVFVNDLYSPEEILSEERDKPLLLKIRQSGIRFLTGDALQTGLPEGVRADLTVAAFLSQYVRDPIALLAHLYNLTRPNGMLVMTTPLYISDATASAKPREEIFREIVSDLKRSRVEVETACDYRTFVLRRRDERKMTVTARLAKVMPITYRPFLHKSTYEPGDRPTRGRWLDFEPTHP